jgi:hypothetical protein
VATPATGAIGLATELTAPVRVFRLIREVDVSGTSGEGHVCDGVRWPDGSCVVRWRTKAASHEIWDSVEQCMSVHGHGGATRLEWLD